MATQPTDPCMFIILDAYDEANTTVEVLRPFCDDIHVSKTIEELDTFVGDLKEKKKTIVLVMTGTLGVRLRAGLIQGEKYAKIDSIYIYCKNIGAHQRWSSEIDKVSAIERKKKYIYPSLSFNDTHVTLTEDDESTLNRFSTFSNNTLVQYKHLEEYERYNYFAL